VQGSIDGVPESLTGTVERRRATTSGSAADKACSVSVCPRAWTARRPMTR